MSLPDPNSESGKADWESILELKGLTKTFNSVEAVKGLNLTIDDKEFMVIVGPSGCGKTTTLRLIAGLEEVTNGEIYLDGKQINKTPPKDRDMAMVFQDYAIYPHMSVYDNMSFGLRMRKMRKSNIAKRVGEAAEMLNVSHLLKRRPYELSGGERQRIALGRAIVRRPKIFLFDEPLANLDASLRSQMREEISRLHKELETTFVYVTHDQIEAMTMASQITVMDRGVLQQTDTTTKIYKEPSNAFVAGFIGNPKMNLLPCCFATQGIELYLYIGKQKIQVPANIKEWVVGKNLLDKPLSFGIRPEHISIDSNPLKKCLIAEILSSENTGPDVYLHLNIHGCDNNIISRIKDEKKHECKKVNISFDWNDIYLFDQNNTLMQY